MIWMYVCVYINLAKYLFNVLYIFNIVDEVEAEADAEDGIHHLMCSLNGNFLNGGNILLVF